MGRALWPPKQSPRLKRKTPLNYVLGKVSMLMGVGSLFGRGIHCIVS